MLCYFTSRKTIFIFTKMCIISNTYDNHSQGRVVTRVLFPLIGRAHQEAFLTFTSDDDLQKHRFRYYRSPCPHLSSSVSRGRVSVTCEHSRCV